MLTMSIKFARSVDRYVGIPICLFLTFLYKIQKSFAISKKGYSSQPKKILFIQLSEMGSMVLGVPAIKAAKKLFPHAEIFFLTFDEMKNSIMALKVVPQENIMTIRGESLQMMVLDTIGFIRKARSLKIDTTIDFELFSRLSAVLSFLSGAKFRSGFFRFYSEGMYRGNMLTHKVAYNYNLHISYGFLSLVHALNAPEDEVPMLKKAFTKDDILPHCITSTVEEKEKMWEQLKAINPKISSKNKIVIIAPDPSPFIPVRAWPLENYIHLTKLLLEDHNVFVVLTGVSQATDNANSIKDTVKSDRCIDLVGKTKFHELIDLYNISDLLISTDGGPGHFASATPIKSIIMFGPETPDLYAPLGDNCIPLSSRLACSPCVSVFNFRRTPCNDNKCMQTIKPDYVYDIAKKTLAKNN